MTSLLTLWYFQLFARNLVNTYILQIFPKNNNNNIWRIIVTIVINEEMKTYCHNITNTVKKSRGYASEISFFETFSLFWVKYSQKLSIIFSLRSKKSVSTKMFLPSNFTTIFEIFDGILGDGIQKLKAFVPWKYFTQIFLKRYGLFNCKNIGDITKSNALLG